MSVFVSADTPVPDITNLKFFNLWNIFIFISLCRLFKEGSEYINYYLNRYLKPC